MKISVITVVYNSRSTIRSAIESVLAQSYPDIEYIVVDGASTDGTMDIVREYSHAINCIISEPDQGIYDAMNKGLRCATGDIVGILNADDYFVDEHVIARIAASFEEAHTEIIYSNVEFISPSNPDKIVRFYSSASFSPELFRFGMQPAHPTFYTRLENFRKYGYYRTDLKIAADFELLLRFIKIRHLSCKYVKDVWVKMRTGGISTGIRNKIRLNNEILQACRLNGLHTNLLLIYSKYLFKMQEFFRIPSADQYHTKPPIYKPTN